MKLVKDFGKEGQSLRVSSLSSGEGTKLFGIQDIFKDNTAYMISDKKGRFWLLPIKDTVITNL